MRGARASRQADDRPAGVGIPVRRTQAGERRNEVHAAAIGHARSELLDIAGFPDDAQGVAQPLHRGAGDEDAAFERILPPADAGRRRREQALPGLDGALARVEEHEAPGAVGALRHARRMAGLAEQRRLLVARDAGDRDGGTQQVGDAVAVDLRGAADFGQQRFTQRRGQAEQGKEFLVPTAGMNVEELGAGGIARVGDVKRAAGELPGEPGIDGAEGEFAALRPQPRIRDVTQYPRQLGRREVRIDHESRHRAHAPGESRCAQALALGGGAAVLPDDRVVHGDSRHTVPDDRGFALIGDADCADRVRPDARLFQRLACARELGAPDFLRIVLDPAGLRVDLRELLLRHRPHPAALVENKRPRTGRALVEREDVFHAGLPKPDESERGRRY